MSCAKWEQARAAAQDGSREITQAIKVDVEPPPDNSGRIPDYI